MGVPNSMCRSPLQWPPSFEPQCLLVMDFGYRLGFSQWPHSPTVNLGDVAGEWSAHGMLGRFVRIAAVQGQI